MKYSMLFLWFVFAIIGETKAQSGLTIFYENSVQRAKIRNIDYTTYFSNFENVPSSFELDDDQYNFTNDHLYADSTKNIKYRYRRGIDAGLVFYRQITAGVRTELINKNRITLHQGIGLQLSKADYRLEEIYKHQTYDKRGELMDHTYGVRSARGYQKERKLGLLYENTFQWNVTKKFWLGIGIRHTLHFKYDDKLMYEVVDTVNYVNRPSRNNDNYYVCGTVSPGFFSAIDRINIYDAVVPTGPYSTLDRKMSMQYDLVLQMKLGLEFNHLNFYGTCGGMPIRAYGSSFGKNYSNINYGLGIQWRL